LTPRTGERSNNMAHVRTGTLNGRSGTGLIIVILGLIFLFQNIYPEFRFWRSLGKLWPLFLVALGIYMILNGLKFRRGTVDYIGSGHNRFVGDMKLEFRGKEIGDVSTSQVIGDLTVDLIGAVLKPGENHFSVSSVIGDTRIHVPANFPLKLSARGLLGDISFDNKTEEGFFPKLEHKDDNYDASSDKLHIMIGGVIGDLTVQRIGNAN